MRILLIILLLSGCNDNTLYENKANVGSSICIDGVEYIKVGHGICPHLKTDGALYLCEKETM